MKKRMICVLLTVILIVGMLPTGMLCATAEDTGNPIEGEIVERQPTEIHSSQESYRLPGGQYIVHGDVTVTGTITFYGDAQIILADGCTLTVTNGIIGEAGADLTFDAQTTTLADMGKVFISATYSMNAGIGAARQGICGDITVNGGIFEVVGGSWGAAIGAGADAKCGIITLNGGKITARGGDYAAAIGSGCPADEYPCVCAGILINGGIVKATGGSDAEHIGKGKDAADVTVTPATGVYTNAEYGCYYVNIEPFPETAATCVDGHKAYYKDVTTGKYYTQDTLLAEDEITDLTAWLSGDGKNGDGTGKHTDKDKDGKCDSCGILAKADIIYHGLQNFTAQNIAAGDEIIAALQDGIASIVEATGKSSDGILYSDGHFVKAGDTVPFGITSLDVYAVVGYPQVDAGCVTPGSKPYYLNTLDELYYADATCVETIGDADDLAEWKTDAEFGGIPAAGHLYVPTSDPCKGHYCVREGCPDAGKVDYHWLNSDCTACKECGTPYVMVKADPGFSDYYAAYTEFPGDGAELVNVWYYVTESVTLTKPLNVVGKDVRLIIADGVTLNCAAGVFIKENCEFEVHYTSLGENKGIFIDGGNIVCYDSTTETAYDEHIDADGNGKCDHCDSIVVGPDALCISLSDGIVEDDTAHEGYNKISWQLNIAPNPNSVYYQPELDFNVYRYGIVCAASEERLEEWMNDHYNTDKVIIHDFGYNSGYPLSKVYKTTNYSLTKVTPGKIRYAVCYIWYEIDGKMYWQYTDINGVTAELPIVDTSNGGEVITDDDLQD